MIHKNLKGIGTKTKAISFCPFGRSAKPPEPKLSQLMTRRSSLLLGRDGVEAGPVANFSISASTSNF